MRKFMLRLLASRLYAFYYLLHALNISNYFKFMIDDIIFGSTNTQLVKEFSKLMYGKIEMSLMGDLTYFLGLQIKQLKEETFVYQSNTAKSFFKALEWKMQSQSTLKSPLTGTYTKMKVERMFTSKGLYISLESSISCECILRLSSYDVLSFHLSLCV